MHIKFSSIDQIFAALNVDRHNPLEVLRVMMIHAFFTNEEQKKNGGVSDQYIIQILEDEEFNQSLASYGIRPLEKNEFHGHLDALKELAEQIRNTRDFFQYFNYLYPYLIKDKGAFGRYANTPLVLYVLLYCLIEDSDRCPPDNRTDGEYIDVHYFSRVETLCKGDLGVFFSCWASVNYYNPKEPETKLPGKLARAKSVFADNKIPLTNLFEMYAGMKTCNILSDPDVRVNPWSVWRSRAKRPIIEQGLSLEETLFNDCVYPLFELPPATVVKGLFYQNRNDAMVESILLSLIQMDIPGKDRVLIVNPSPDFLEEYTKTWNYYPKATIAVPSKTVAAVYSIYNRHFDEYITFEDLQNRKMSFDYIIVMARDSSLDSFSAAFFLRNIDTKILAFVPQTMLTSKKDNILKVFDSNNIYVDTLLPIPRELSQSSKRKKVILQAHIQPQKPKSVALMATTYAGNKYDHYMLVDRKAKVLPYDMLYKGYTTTQLLDYYEKMQSYEMVEGKPKRKNEAALVYPFSREILVHYHLYKEDDGQFSARACYRSVVSECDKRAMGNRLTGYTERGLRGTLSEIYEALNAFVLDPRNERIIGEEIERFYNNKPEVLTLKTVWLCCREELKKSELSYDDALAIRLFCGECQDLSNLVIGEAGEEYILQMLNNTLNDEAEGRHKRLVELIFKTAVSRNFLENNPFPPRESSFASEMRKAMRQLRSALSKSFLSFDEIRRVTDFLLEPMDKNQTPRAVKESQWLAALIRLCTGMPLRQICALQWKHFQEIEECIGARQLNVVQHVNDLGEIVPVEGYRYVRQYRLVPCVPILGEVLVSRREYIRKLYGVSEEELREFPIVCAEEPAGKRKGRKKLMMPCSLKQARKASTEALKKADIPSNVITLLDGDEAFQEDLNTGKNDLYYSNFLHYANNLCGLGLGQVNYIVGRKPPDCFSNHYEDFRNDFVQLDMIKRLSRLWTLVYADKHTQSRAVFSAVNCYGEYYAEALPYTSGLAAVDMSIIPLLPSEIQITVESESGVDGLITVFGKEDS